MPKKSYSPVLLNEENNITNDLQEKKYIPLPETNYSNYVVDDVDIIEPAKPVKCSKYSNALKTILPFRPSAKDKSKLPSNKAGLLSYISLTWLTTLMRKAYKQPLEPEDLWELQDEDNAEKSWIRIQRLWQEEQDKATEKRPAQLWRAVVRSARTRIIVAIMIALINNFLHFVGPSILLKLTLDYIDMPKIDHFYGTNIVIAIFMVNILRGATFNLMFVIGAHTSTRLIGGIQSLVYRKILKLKTGGEKLSAQLTNILSNDMERLFEACISCVFVTAGPVLFIATAIYSVIVIGPWALLGMLVYLLFYPVMALVAKAQSRIRLKTVKKTDKRVSLMSEILNSFKLIKMYAWEDSFADKISEIRRTELARHRIGALLHSCSATLVPSISILAVILTILGYTLSGYSLTSAQAFTIYSMFTAMQFTIGVLPFTLRVLVEAKVALGRMQMFLELPECSKQNVGLVNNSLALSMKNATFAWEVHTIDFAKGGPATPAKKSSPPEVSNETEDEDKKKALITNENNEIVETLFGVNLSIERGKLIGICGSVGAGKSSLVSAICGDMKLQCGELQVNGRLALVSQLAWIFNATLRENILVGHPYDEQRFRKTIEVCSLQTDLDLLPSGDLTELGEKGVNLSGGQKQRVNLARAVYSNRDIYLLDDPLSAVDANVANALFNNCINGVLKHKTVLLISHGVHFLEKCDEIILMKNGRICERGKHCELVERKGEYFNILGFDPTKDYEDSDISNETAHDGPSKDKNADKNGTGGQLMTEEMKGVGAVGGQVYLKFMRACGGCGVLLVVFLALVLFTLARIFNIVWLQRWLDTGDGLESLRIENKTLYNTTYSNDELKGDITNHPQLWMFQMVFALSFVILIATGVTKGVGIAFRVLAGASNLHSDMFHSILRTPMRFLETTPTGRILNRFSRDMDELDTRIPFFLEFVCQGLLSISSQIIMVSVIFPFFLIPLLVIAVLFVWVDIFLNAGVREMKRLDNNLKSYVIQHVIASISGLSAIRAFDREKIFIERFEVLLNKHSASFLCFRLSNRWFTFRMDMMATIVTIAITIICVFTKGQLSTALAGLALSTVYLVCGFIPFFMRMKSEFQSRMTSVERIMEYAYELESEAPREIEDTAPPSSWPSTGSIEMKEVKLRYRPELPLVLHGVSASIMGSEKIGIVGRTGAGKSSLISTLLRLVELDSGLILIDDIDIRTIGLNNLRSAISVIPQDPVLFQGSIRYNIDPFNHHSDEAVWTAFERAHLKSMIQKLPAKLESEVEAAGQNFSVGERQLICLARALLRNSKILLLDEATASVDVETDHLIQETIKEAFNHCTILTIAHRLNTVASYDRIMVMDAGKITEFDTPSALMSTDGSMFKQMMSAVGIFSLDQIKS